MRIKIYNNKSFKKKLPSEKFYTKIIGACFEDKFYSKMYPGAPAVPCSGPHFCEYPQRSDIRCVHVDASYENVPRMSPISFYFAVKPRMSFKIGCYA
ncbi:unnamed protein product [Caenorhabditis angaria]|uniref:Uncharacterized protein n=1 Tax=Caenorhabditis angaria TaxID=860376 RepID=A0A9P1IXE6_9PELO|nr:unnamed protein product [Caenorhabditis angaria]